MSEAMENFLSDTRKLWEDLDKKSEEPEKEPAAEEPVPAEEAQPAPETQVEIPPPEKPKDEESGFIQDWSKATPEQYQKRISYLYAKDKEHSRQWAEAREILRKQREEVEKLREETARARLQHTESELDRLQLQAVELLNPNSPSYNPQEGAKVLRELTNRDVELKNAKEEEKKRSEAFKVDQEAAVKDQNIAETKAVLDAWAQSRPYAQPGHQMYPQVVAWIKNAYDKAPPEVTVQQIVDRASEIFDARARPQEQRAEKPNAPGVGGEKLTVSQVIGTPSSRPSAGNPADKLSAAQRQVAEKLFLGGAAKTKAEAYKLYSEGL